MDPYESNNMSPLEMEKNTRDANADKKKEELLQDDVQEAREEVRKLESNANAYVQAFMAHVYELRKQIIKTLIIFIIFFAAIFFSIDKWFPIVTNNYPLVVLGPLEIIKFYTLVSAVLACGLALPFFIHFMWAFIKPGLKDIESHFLKFYSPIILLLFIGGLAFGYFIVNPLSYSFLISLGTNNFEIMISAGQYIHFLMMTTLPLGFMFELPIIALFLSHIDMLKAESMKKIRGYSYLFMALVSALITPPDFISQLLVMFPMILLYEVSIFVVRRFENRQSVEKSTSLNN
ncbi:twin-arginine translocase subunit TatC [Lysinibacillus sp. LZ02]|uniref:twin-arginine translocase subunit TatC n=1 Tax=Lysinibacillus sp. LZ02 TaxID=3420668 RepID=UPI003D35F7EA